MKTSTAVATLLSVVAIAGASVEPPDNLKAAFAILTRSYPNVDAQKFPRPPADSAWLLRATSSAVGTAEIGFQGDQVVYMIFRRGVGGLGWKRHDIDALHALYCKDLLKERECGETYTSWVASQINAAIIIRKDFDAKSLLSGM